MASVDADLTAPAPTPRVREGLEGCDILVFGNRDLDHSKSQVASAAKAPRTLPRLWRTHETVGEPLPARVSASSILRPPIVTARKPLAVGSESTQIVSTARAPNH